MLWKLLFAVVVALVVVVTDVSVVLVVVSASVVVVTSVVVTVVSLVRSSVIPLVHDAKRRVLIISGTMYFFLISYQLIKNIKRAAR